MHAGVDVFQHFIEEFVPVIQATLAPMFLIVGAGIYLNFIQARLFRAVDRIRDLEKTRTERLEEGKTVDEQAVMDEVRFQVSRIRNMRNAVALGSMTMVFTAVAAVLMILGFFFRTDGVALPVLATFSVALFCLGASLLYGVNDTYLSIKTVERGLWSEVQRELRKLD